MKKKQNKTNRRSFLNRLWLGLGTVTALQLGGISVFYFVKTREKNVNEELVFATIGKVEDFQPGTVTPYRNGRFYLVRYNDGGFLALSITCTHLGCSITYESNRNEFVCPCHASVFDIYGDVVNPPAPRTLDMLPVQIINGNVQVALGDNVHRRKFEKTQLVYA